MPPTNTTERSGTNSERFYKSVETTKVSSLKQLPLDVIKYFFGITVSQVFEKIPDEEKEAFKATYVTIFLDKMSHQEIEELLLTLEGHFNLKSLFEINYPYLYRVHSTDPNGPIVSFYSFSNPYIDNHVTSAWTAAATSRSLDDYATMFRKMIEMGQEDPDKIAEKIRKFGISYGHSSILELVPVFVFINNVPIEAAYFIHHVLETYASQEASTRYIELENFAITDISKALDLDTIPPESIGDKEHILKEWLELKQILVGNYKKWKDKVDKALREQFGEYLVNGEKPIQNSTFEARTLDVVRGWIPMGAPTSMAVLSNLRTFINLLVMLRETTETRYTDLADQIQAALEISDTQEGREANARLGPLIRYSEPQLVIRNNIAALSSYLQQNDAFLELVSANREHVVEDFNAEATVELLDNADALTVTVIQYIKVAFPSIEELDILNWLNTLSDDQKAQIGSIIFKGHDRHHPMRNMGNIKGDKVYIVKAALAQLRDFNRQRSMGRADVGYALPLMHSPKPLDYGEIIQNGFILPPQIREMYYLKEFEEEWKEDVNSYYFRLLAFYRFLRERFPEHNLDFIRDLIPLGHKSTFHMSPPISQASYIGDLRTTGGNDVANILIMEQINSILVESSPFLRDIEQGRPFDLNNPSLFADRT